MFTPSGRAVHTAYIVDPEVHRYAGAVGGIVSLTTFSSSTSTTSVAWPCEPNAQLEAVLSITPVTDRGWAAETPAVRSERRYGCYEQE